MIGRALTAALVVTALSALAPSLVIAQSPERADTIVVAIGRNGRTVNRAISIQLLDVKDSRCPRGARCIWAGHATALLLVTTAGSRPESVTVGTVAPPERKLPTDTVVGGHRLHLIALTPGPVAERRVAKSRYRATIEIRHP